MDEQMYILMAKALSDEATGEELRELKVWLDADAANKAVYEDMKLLWQDAGTMLQQPSFDAGPAWEKVAARTVGAAMPVAAERERKRIVFPAWMKWSAAAALLIGGLIGYQVITREHNVMVAALDGTKVISLPDHSKVTLQKGSRLTYPATFAAARRNVTLEGEAFFEVARNEQKPFIIAAQSVDVQVLGTSFNVSCDADAARVVVATGKVQVSSRKQPEQQVLLTPGEKAIYKNEQLREMADTNAAYYKTGKLNFNNKTFEEILQVLGQVKDISIPFDVAVAPATRQQLIVIAFNNQTLEEMLTDLCLITGTRFTKTQKNYVISVK